MIDTYFRIQLLHIMPTTFDFFVTVGVFVSANASDWVHVAWSWHKYSQAKSKHKIKHMQLSYYDSRAPISNVKVKNISSAGFIQLIFVSTVIKNFMCSCHFQF